MIVKNEYKKIDIYGPAYAEFLFELQRGRQLDDFRELKNPVFMAGWKGLEPSTFCVTGRRSNQLNYHPTKNTGFMSIISLIF